MKKILAFSVFVAAFAAQAATLPFTYNFEDAEPSAYRKFKSKPTHDSETIDVAVFVDGAFAGKKITGISVPVTGDVSALTDFGAFLTTKPATKNQGAEKFNAPDICSVDATLVDGVLTAVFAEPYTVTEAGVYVGYSLTDTSMKAEPVAVVDGYTPGSFWYRGSDANAKWTDLGKSRGASSALTVMLDGDFAPAYVSVVNAAEVFAAVGEPGFTEVEMRNFGTAPVKSISYKVTAAGTVTNYDMELPSEIPARLGYPFDATFEIPAFAELGDYNVEIAIDGVDGIANTAVNGKGNSACKVLPFVPKNNPLVEEYTGLDCGYCPRGYVMLRQMHDMHGVENFVAISYHSMLESGCMVHLDKYPYTPSSIPAAQVNRSISPNVSDIPDTWSYQRRKPAPGEVTVSLRWADATRTEMVAEAKTRFLEDIGNSPYLLSFCVVADGLSNPDWSQNNAYAGKTGEETAGFKGDYWDLFIGENAKSQVQGLVFDDVAVFYPDQQGEAASLPSDIKGGEWYEREFRFKPGDIVNSKGEHVINDFEKLRVIAVINDTATKTVVNSASSLYADGSGAVEAVASAASDSPVYYTLSGIRVSNPVHGIFIRVSGGKAVKVRL